MFLNKKSSDYRPIVEKPNNEIESIRRNLVKSSERQILNSQSTDVETFKNLVLPNTNSLKRPVIVHKNKQH